MTSRLRRKGGYAAIMAARQEQVVVLSQASSKAASQKLRDEARETLKWLHEHPLRSLNAQEVTFWKEQAS